MDQHSVWLFTRPLTLTRVFPPMAKSSDPAHLRHWGILVAELSLADANAALSAVSPDDMTDKTLLGKMYELFREKNDLNNVKINTLTRKSLREEWPMFSSQHLGRSEKTHSEIKAESDPQACWTNSSFTHHQRTA